MRQLGSAPPVSCASLLAGSVEKSEVQTLRI
jgi:hypothetical protein